MFAFLIQLAVSPFSWTLQTVGRQRQQLTWHALRLFATIVVIVGVRHLGGTALVAVSGYAIVLCVAYVTMALIIRSAFQAAEAST